MKIKRIHYSILFILPVLLALTAVYLNNARGPFWLGTNLDPDYVYLLNAANTADLEKVGHIDHPGTTVQVLGAITMRMVHFFHFSANVDLHTDILQRPEYYLNAINTVMTVLNTLALLFLGLGAFTLTGNIWLSLWLQLAPFFSIPLLNAALTRVAPESLLLFSGLLVILLLVKFMYSSSHSYGDALWFVLVIGFGIAAKITFLPLLVIPVIIFPGLKKKLAYIAGVLVSFVIFTIPIISMYDKFFNWIGRILTHKKSYGTGGRGIISLPLYIKNIKKLLMGNPFFTVVLLTAIILAAIVLIIPGLRRASTANVKFKLLVSVLAAQVIAVLMVGKHPASHYLLPALSLSGVTIFLIFYIYKDLFARFKLNINYLTYPCILFIAGSFIFINPVGQVMDLTRQKSRIRDKSLAVYREAERKYRDYAKIYYYASSSSAYALKFGNDLSRNYHNKILQQLYKNVYFYDFFRKKFFTFDYSQNVPLGIIRARYGDKILFQGPQWISFPGLTLKKVYKSGFQESIFLVDADTGTIKLIRQTAAWIEANIEKDSVLVVPEEWLIETTRLQQDYNIVPVDYKKFERHFFYSLALFLEKPYFLIPDIHFYGKNAIAGGSIKKLREFKEQIKIEAVFPDKKRPLFFIGTIGTLNTPGAGESLKPFSYEEIKVWYPLEKNPKNICPSLYILGGHGKFRLNFNRETKRNRLEVSNIEPGEKGGRVCRLGFMTGKKGFNLEVPHGKYIYLMAEVDIPGHLVNKDNRLFIQDFAGRWERESMTFSGAGRLIYLVSKKIRPSSTKVALGIQFVPQSAKDKLITGNIRVFVSGDGE